MQKPTRIWNSTPFPWIVAGFFSLLLSAWQMTTQDVINPDGICYLQSAAAVLRDRNFAMHLCPQSAWPFYHVFIAGVSALTGFSVFVAAELLNAFLSLGTVLIFPAILSLLTNNKRMIWFGVLVILLAHHLNAYRVDVIRDHGYWAFYLLSIYWMLRYVSVSQTSSRWICGGLWAASIGIAALFRIESIIFLILLSWFIFLMPRQTIKERFTALISLNSLLILVFPFVCYVWAKHSIHALGRLDYLYAEFLHGGRLLIDHWHQASLTMSQSILSVYAASDAGWVLGFGLLGYYLVCLVDVLTPIYVVLVAYGMFMSRARPSGRVFFVLSLYVLINVGITVFFLAQHFFLARRYLMAFSLTLMLWVPFALDDLFRQWSVRKWPFILAIFFVLLCSIGGIIRFGASNAYISESGRWLLKHAGVSDKIYSNDAVLLYYAGRSDKVLFGPRLDPAMIATHHRWRHYDWLALKINHSVPSMPSFGLPVQVFRNKRGAEIKIYQIKKGDGA